MKKNFAIFVSGYGRGAIEIINAFKEDKLQVNLALVVTSNNSSGVINVSKNNEIPCEFIDSKEYPTKIKFETEINEVLKKFNIDYIFLAGWMKIIGKTMLQKYANRIVNIHPSLLPSFKGLNAIDQALNYKVKITGVTTHYVNETIDGGEIIMQKPVFIESNDDFKSLDKKIFKTGTEISIETINKIFSL